MLERQDSREEGDSHVDRCRRRLAEPLQDFQFAVNDATHETHLKVLRHLEENPDITQRELAEALGVSLGKVNYCLKALIEKGWIKANNFKNHKQKSAYAYLLTPKGIERKAQITVRFLKRKVEEYEALKQEIEQLQEEVERLNGPEP